MELVYSIIFLIIGYGFGSFSTGYVVGRMRDIISSRREVETLARPMLFVLWEQKAVRLPLPEIY